MRYFWWILAAIIIAGVTLAVHAELVHGQDQNRILRPLRTDETGRPMVVGSTAEPDLTGNSWCLGPCAADGSTTDQIGAGTYKVVWFDEQTRVRVGVTSVGAAEGIVGNPGYESVYTIYEADTNVACRSGGSGHVCFHGIFMD